MTAKFVYVGKRLSRRAAHGVAARKCRRRKLEWRGVMTYDAKTGWAALV